MGWWCGAYWYERLVGEECDRLAAEDGADGGSSIRRHHLQHHAVPEVDGG